MIYIIQRYRRTLAGGWYDGPGVRLDEAYRTSRAEYARLAREHPAAQTRTVERVGHRYTYLSIIAEESGG